MKGAETIKPPFAYRLNSSSGEVRPQTKMPALARGEYYESSDVQKLAATIRVGIIVVMAHVLAAHWQVAQAQTAQAAEMVPEQVLITGSLIPRHRRGQRAVTDLSVQDFRITGAATTADLFRSVPVANVSPGAVATNSQASSKDRRASTYAALMPRGLARL